MLGIVVPVFNEGRNVELIYNSINKYATKYNIDYKLVFVDDGSTDVLTLSIYDKLNNCYILRNKHKGQHSSILSGFKYLQDSCDYVCTIDCDMQDPPNVLFLMYLKLISTDADAIRGVRLSRNDSFLKVVSARGYYSLLSFILKSPIANSSDFYILKSSCIHLLDVNNLRLSIWVNCNVIDYKYTRNKRMYGKTKYSIIKLVSTALSGLKYTISIKKKVK